MILCFLLFIVAMLACMILLRQVPRWTLNQLIPTVDQSGFSHQTLPHLRSMLCWHRCMTCVIRTDRRRTSFEEIGHVLKRTNVALRNPFQHSRIQRPRIAPIDCQKPMFIPEPSRNKHCDQNPYTRRKPHKASSRVSRRISVLVASPYSSQP